MAPVVAAFQDVRSIIVCAEDSADAKKKRGICNSVCYTSRTRLWDGFFPEGGSHLHADLVDSINGGSMQGLGARKPMSHEKAKGLQIVYCYH